MVQVTNLTTGEVTEFKGKMMVASNGTILIKSKDKVTLWASAAPHFLVEVK